MHTKPNVLLNLSQRTTGLAAVTDKITHDLVSEFKTKLLGIMLTGSYINSFPKLNSDLDVIVVVKGVRRQRRNILFGNLEIEYFINPVVQYLSYMEEDKESGRGAMQHMLITGNTIFDPKGALKRLKREAERQWKAGPSAITRELAWRARYLPADMLRDIYDVAEKEPATANFLVNVALSDLLDLHYRIRRRWRPKKKRLLHDLATWDRSGAAFVSRVVSTELKTRLLTLEALMKHVLRPLGGPMPIEWKTDWQKLRLTPRRV